MQSLKSKLSVAACQFFAPCFAAQSGTSPPKSRKQHDITASVDIQAGAGRMRRGGSGLAMGVRRRTSANTTDQQRNAEWQQKARSAAHMTCSLKRRKKGRQAVARSKLPPSRRGRANGTRGGTRSNWSGSSGAYGRTSARHRGEPRPLVPFSRPVQKMTAVPRESVTGCVAVACTPHDRRAERIRHHGDH